MVCKGVGKKANLWLTGHRVDIDRGCGPATIVLGLLFSSAGMSSACNNVLTEPACLL